MADRAIKEFAIHAGPVIIIVVLLLASLSLMSDSTQNSERFAELYSTTLAINAVGLMILGGLIVWNIVRLIGQVRRGSAGARMTVRMVAMFVLLSLTPVLVVYYFSLKALHDGIDSWFDVRVEKALDDSLELSREAFDGRMVEILSRMRRVALELVDLHDDALPLALDDARRRTGADDLTLIDTRRGTEAHGHIIATSSRDSTSIVPRSLSVFADAAMLLSNQPDGYVGLDVVGDSGLQIRLILPIPYSQHVLHGIYPIPPRMSELADNVSSAYANYNQRAYMRKDLKISFTLTLSLVLLLSLFTAVWAAFVSARRLVAPLRDLAQGTQAVAEGNYETQLAQSGKHEVGFLVDSFNVMTRRLARARDDARLSQRQVEEQRTYLEAVLARLSSGVMTFDNERRLHTVNEAAAQILGVALDTELGKTLQELALRHQHLRPLADALYNQLGPNFEHAQSTEWRDELSIFGQSGRKTLFCAGTPLLGQGSTAAGFVVVFDDITALIQAQRNAAWSEVARRLAHEIKNPLTPIQLSAERLRHKYLDTMDGKDAERFDRLTRTIVQQVEAMKGMVNAFSDYARTPQMRPAPLNLNELITDVIELYASDQNTTFSVELDENLPIIDADADRLRQVLHNLLKNAVEASTHTESPSIVVRTRWVNEPSRSFAEARIVDSGPGVPSDIIEQVFEPYVTTKPKGSGLGLAIVKKIVEEHGGMVWAENISNAGAAVVLQFPVVSVEVQDNHDEPARREAV